MSGAEVHAHRKNAVGGGPEAAEVVEAEPVQQTRARGRMLLRAASRALVRNVRVAGTGSRTTAKITQKFSWVSAVGVNSQLLHTTPRCDVLTSSRGGDFQTGAVGVDLEKEPTMEEAENMVRSYSEMPNDSLLILASIGDHDAHAERLRREIMAVDGVNYATACVKLDEVDGANNEYMGMLTLPYKIGIASFMFTGVASLPMVFHLGIAKWFNEEYVTMDLPEAKDIETWLEVGAWTWNWMEPVLGTLSFVLLAFQFTRAQMLNLGKAPYSEWVIKNRAIRLSKKYPQYNKMIIKQYARSDALAH